MREQTPDTSILVPTEQVNPRTRTIDQQSTAGVLQLINAEDQLVAAAVSRVIPEIAVVVDAIVNAFQQGGRLVYVGAGTSGRLGVLDASECPPTFGVSAGQVQGIIAGGETALRSAVEGAEDSPEDGRQDVLQAGIGPWDVVVGISASGNAPYVVAAVETARSMGCFTAGITCNAASHLAKAVNQPIVVPVGPEAIAGSSRMKAGTAQKLILNMLSTAAMIQSGKTYENLMVDVQPTNQKLRDRARRIVSALSGVSEDEAAGFLAETAYQVKPAVFMAVAHRKGCPVTPAAALEKLAAVSGKLRAALALSDS